jgi:hypothetical protein
MLLAWVSASARWSLIRRLTSAVLRMCISTPCFPLRR